MSENILVTSFHLYSLRAEKIAIDNTNKEEKNIEDLMKRGREDDTTVVDVSVAIWFTKEFAEVEDDVQG